MQNNLLQKYLQKRVSVQRCPFFIGLCLLFLASLVSCRQAGSGDSGKRSSFRADSTLNLLYAKGFSIQYGEDCQRVTVRNPWSRSDKPLQVYYLYRELPRHCPADGVCVKVPLKALGIGSCTHVEFLNCLGVLPTVQGACNVERLYNEYLRTSRQEGRLADLGDAFQLNVEKTVSLGLDALMVSGQSQMDERLAFLQKNGLPVVYNNEWMEETLLGRAEWIRFVGAFFDCESLADSLFRETERACESIRKTVEQAGEERPSVLTGEDFRGTWYLPGGRSFLAQAIRDAGGTYAYASDTTRGSLPTNLESVLCDMSQSDCWVGVDYASLEDMARADRRYTLFKAWQEHRVYSWHRFSTPQGGSDFWESAVAHPDWLLSDLASLLHPDLFPGTEWHFLRQLK